jgi:hypothetical protein
MSVKRRGAGAEKESVSADSAAQHFEVFEGCDD